MKTDIGRGLLINEIIDVFTQYTTPIYDEASGLPTDERKFKENIMYPDSKLRKELERVIMGRH